MSDANLSTVFGDPGEPIVEIEGLYYHYNGQEVLRDIQFTVNTGDFVTIIGPNGGGKTTLVKIILGLLTPRRGTVLVNGKKPGENGAVIGYVPQYINHNLSFPASAIDVVLMGKYDPKKRFRFGNKKQDRKEAFEVLGKLGMANLAKRKITDLSAGQRQRVLIARALVTNPDLLVLDEPTASLDTKGQTEFFELLKILNKDLTILVVSHDLLVVASYAKSIACVNKRLHYHKSVGTTGELMDAFYSCSVEEVCPVEHVMRKIPIKVQSEIRPHV
ncbi:MAG: ABC transporter ATP-binding protein [Desulfobulbaceae bacterium]|nr:ABC transporter ATP-binding protein [Desulfobulbaceae bacterium]